jgi:hypothetical protein
MRVRYFYLDENDRVHKAGQRAVEGAVLRRDRWDDSQGTKPLRIISFLCDDALRPLKGYITRFEVADGFVTQWSDLETTVAMASVIPIERNAGPDCPYVKKQLEGWPLDPTLLPQLANAMDIPFDQLPTLYFGGPLVMALRLRVSVRQALTYTHDDDD